MNTQNISCRDVKLSNNNNEMQLDVIYNFLKNSYWAKGIPKEFVEKSLDNSLCFGAFINNRKIAFARVITDKISFAYLADVFVLDHYRNEGISKKLMTYLLQHQDLQCIRKFMLCTADAHGLYEQFGFTVVKSPESLMAINQPDLYLAL